MAAKPQIIRLLTLGDSGAGKSSLLLRYTQNEFNVEYMPTIGIDFRLKTVEVNGKTVKVQVWVRLDTTPHSLRRHERVARTGPTMQRSKASHGQTAGSRLYLPWAAAICRGSPL
jgi:small GTP-binding protein